MRYIRLRIANYRGVTKFEDKFAETGITLVRGPNEVGKTSLGEAINLLFKYPDSSKAVDITAIKPVNRDEGPEIELEAESGPYRFIYSKRYLKKPETRLIIMKPKAENLTGREAHERAELILRETLDIDLWKALSVRQGAEINLPMLKGQTWLSQALDRAAGGQHSADPRAESLFEVVHGEYNKYFNEKGAEKKEIAESRANAEKCQSEVQIIEQQMRELDGYIEHSTSLKLELVQLKKSGQDSSNEVEKRTANLEKITRLEQDLSAAKLALDLSKAEEKITREAKEKREKLIQSVKDAVKDLEDKLKDCESAFGFYEKAKGESDERLKVYSSVEGNRNKILDLIELRQRDREYYQDKFNLYQLQVRKERIDDARKKAAKSRTILKTNKVDEAALKEIKAAQTAVDRAIAKLGSKAPIVQLRGLGKCKLTKDGTPLNLRKGEEVTIPVPNSIKFAVPDEFEMKISAGASTETLSKAVEKAQSELKELCTSLGIDDPDKAQEAFQERQEAAGQIDNLEKVEKEARLDLTYDQMVNMLLELQLRVPAYLQSRVAEPAILDDSESTKKELTELKKSRKIIDGEWEESKTDFEGLKAVSEGRYYKYIEEDALCKHQKESLGRLQDTLKMEQTIKSDSEVNKELADAMSVVKKDLTSCDTIAASLKSLNPEQEKDFYDTAKDSLDRIQKRMGDAKGELIEVTTRLHINGEDGLWEKLNAAQTALVRSEYEYNSLISQASAVSILYKTMREERDKARHAYIAPLRGKIESLGRMVFDDTLQIDIDDDLQIVSRTLQGATVDFTSLSTGTREQLSLVFRLACAMLVAEDGGAPIMVDDALGYTDPERLKLMGAILAKAAKECQIVIFTCVPDRYSNIGAAKEIVMAK